jgi:sulfoxide reductase catalytic subunit YedY
MAPLIKIPRPWDARDLRPTPEEALVDRRRFLRELGLASAGVAGSGIAAIGASATLGCGANGEPAGARSSVGAPAYEPISAPRNPDFKLDRPLTDEAVAARYNNFYEFTEAKERVHELARSLRLRPWTVEVTGLVQKPGTFDVDEISRTLPVEERLYRHRCVEAWAMAVPWVGFPLRSLLERVQPLAAARHVRFVSFKRPEEAPNQGPRSPYPWPYFEGLTLPEAAHPLTLMAIGVYGHAMPPQHGAPIRLVVPWKYGFKSIKSVVRIELTAEQPPTFWNTVSAHEYDFSANVDPDVPHPRWSQASERMIDTGERRPTLKFNGYGEWVAGLYGG